eukprot:5314966-Amphidinium_carterae.3
MPDFKGQDVVRARQLADQQKERWRTRIGQFARLLQKRGRKDGNSLKQGLLANKFHLQGLDQSLKIGTGLCVADFCSSSSAMRGGSTEVFFDVGLQKLPESVRVASVGRTRKRCVMDKDTRKRTYCVPPNKKRRICHFHMDEGPENLRNRLWLIQCKSWRGHVFPDMSHRRHNNFVQSCRDAGIHWVLQDLTLLTSIGSAPFNKAGHFGKLSEAVLELTENFTPSDDMFSLLYPWLLWLQHGGEFPLAWQSSCHKERVWKSMKEARLTKFKGERTKMGRWYQPVQRWRQRRSESGFLLVALVYIAVHEEWYGSLEDSPLANITSNKAGATHALKRADIIGEQGENRSVEHSNVHFQGMDPKKGLETVLRALCQGGGVALYNLVSELSAPLEAEFGKSMSECKTCAGCVNWASDMAACERWQCIAALWSEWESWKLSLRLGMSSTHTEAPRLSNEEASEVLRLGYQYVIAQTGYEVLFQEGYYSCPPFLFAALLSPVASVRAEAMLRCKALWEALQRVEQGTTHAGQRSSWLESMLWPTSAWVMETLVSLYETEWGVTPPEL